MIQKFANDLLVLERFKVSDSQDILDALTFSYKEISPWLNWLTPEYNLKSAEDFIYLQINHWYKNIEYTFTIRNHSGDLLGVIGLHCFDKQNDVAMIGYWMSSKFTGNGYCTQALKLLVENSLVPLNLIRIEVMVALENIASQKVAENAGATFEAVLKNRIRPGGIATDAKMYAFTSSK